MTWKKQSGAIRLQLCNISHVRAEEVRNVYFRISANLIMHIHAMPRRQPSYLFRQKCQSAVAAAISTSPFSCGDNWICYFNSAPRLLIHVCCVEKVSAQKCVCINQCRPPWSFFCRIVIWDTSQFFSFTTKLLNACIYMVMNCHAEEQIKTRRRQFQNRILFLGRQRSFKKISISAWLTSISEMHCVVSFFPTAGSQAFVDVFMAKGFHFMSKMIL